ncbi:MAG TPA: efflux RND transporter periplasmic adaptor subunit [Leeuwenhoekiella sp.]|uniref:efflux RND transporter periplasmic adaptor subunit n=2 Tax=Flavobacteriaceae TaxID=49546 RepID=UPI000C39A489|nr:MULTISPECIES: efflux RND transporter periplasmic adaptor subunit [Leeuwenhoekiella]MAS20921.1 efflux transporter periplasmic adaptor subunit [Leeuwenhoekiella sp.]MBH13114.1 efflux transporter periplasmic adaptor subunit [Leeuwenhoekiella sp.]UBZ11515.1 efflux RND transporter periplasmic adaptor subunit [Leeuwenhoekiella palythoae]HAX15985.1 efflux RND transporter periplasmic adaptor subunit [Leeuwenhoekiella sp.]HCQ75495.1 efflux RND transporter periplasmic adaptor subunit [Leeuwenhoekiell|tara:strand:+ start:2786 stop:4048 length:1263 start_codon:yes stop_codon:yes gene_type:complete
MNRKTLIIILVVAVVLIAALIGGKKAGLFGKTGEFKPVETQEIALASVVETVAATGKIQPETEVKISSEVSGEIIELPVVEGQQVEKGDLLVRINPDLIQSALTQAQASLQNVKANQAQSEAALKVAKANYERNQKLFEKGVISRSEWDQSISDYEIAQANVKSAFYNVQSAAANVNQSRDNLSRTSIYAPISGTISKLDVELGERVVGTQQMAGTEMMRVADLGNMEVEVDVNENDIVKINIGDSTRVEVDAYLKKRFKGEVTEIANSAESNLTADQVTNFKVKVRILEESYKDLVEGKPEAYSPFRPGMTATVDIITNRVDDAISVPISAIVIKNDTTATTGFGTSQYEAVFVKNGDKASLKRIKTGIQDDSNIVVSEGLETGDEVITGPYNTVTKLLKDGDMVEVKKDAKFGASEED